jgi:hypothetical protein
MTSCSMWLRELGVGNDPVGRNDCGNGGEPSGFGGLVTPGTASDRTIVARRDT